jgi:hypothetical protein
VTQQERWDVVLKVLNGPLAKMGEQVIRGPVVRIGGDPGPGGLKLGGYRGLDARQCVITAYTGGTASVAPVGTNQVRLAPHRNVNWGEIDPLVGPQYLTPGCALHLGPVGRGATIEFVQCKRLGEWQAGVIQSERADGPRGLVPEAYDVRRVGLISASSTPFWFLGCSTLMASTTAGIILMTGIGFWLVKDPPPLGVVADGYEFYDSVDPTTAVIDPRIKEGLLEPYYEFVMKPNIEAAGGRAKGWENKDLWDQRFIEYMTASVNAHHQAWRFYARLEAVRVEYEKVVLALRKARMPEVFAGIPYQESRYTASITSEVCAEGYWQFMPEVAYRLQSKEKLAFRVADCKFKASTGVLWSPSELAPPPGVRKNAPYMDGGVCMIERCNVDDRKDLERSTEAAVFTLREAWIDPLIAQSGAAVQLTITSHNAGYDDSRFGEKYRKQFNVKPAFKSYIDRNGSAQGMHFVGNNIRCPTTTEQGTCNAAYMAETQHYAYTIVAQHLLAVCYYSKNYGELPGFTPWRLVDSYCDKFEIPSSQEVKAHRPSNTGGK